MYFYISDQCERTRAFTVLKSRVRRKPKISIILTRHGAPHQDDDATLWLEPLLFSLTMQQSVKYCGIVYFKLAGIMVDVN